MPLKLWQIALCFTLICMWVEVSVQVSVRCIYWCLLWAIKPSKWGKKKKTVLWNRPLCSSNRIISSLARLWAHSTERSHWMLLWLHRTTGISCTHQSGRTEAGVGEKKALLVLSLRGGDWNGRPRALRGCWETGRGRRGCSCCHPSQIPKPSPHFPGRPAFRESPRLPMMSCWGKKALFGMRQCTVLGRQLVRMGEFLILKGHYAQTLFFFLLFMYFTVQARSHILLYVKSVRHSTLR